MDQTSEAILALKPVTFQYKSDVKGALQFGLIAEEVAEVNPDLVVRDKGGAIYSVRYDAVNAMLLNEFLKEHRKNEEQEATIAHQQQQLLKEHQKNEEQEANIAQLKSSDAKQEAIIAQQKERIDLLIARLDEQESQIQKVSAQLAACSSSQFALSKTASQTAFITQ